MQSRSKRELFYREVGEAMSMIGTRSFINMETLDVQMHPDGDAFGEEAFMITGMQHTPQEALDNPGRFLEIETASASGSFKIMKAFADTIKDKNLQLRLVQSLQGKKPFVNFKMVVDNSAFRQAWFDFRDNAYTEMAKGWIEENAPGALKEKVKLLPAVFIA